MQNQLSMAVEKIHDVLQQKGSMSLTNLESTVNVSYNLLFLAICKSLIGAVVRGSIGFPIFQ